MFLSYFIEVQSLHKIKIFFFLKSVSARTVNENK